MSCKTVRVDLLKDHINFFLANSVGDKNEDRHARSLLILMAESFFFDNSIYNGFNYLTADRIPVGTSPGIVWNDNEPCFDNTDSTRIEFN